MSDMVSADEAQGLLDGTTPGPWDDVRVGHEGDGSARSHEEQVCGIDAQAVAIVTHDGSVEARANTRLMYAAPDLAETVVALHAVVERLRTENASMRATLGELYAAGVIDGTGRLCNPMLHARGGHE